MDSSRNGLLSTILMTLPLIAVPAMALLRPPGQASVSTKPLEAQEESTEDFLLDSDEAPLTAEDELLFEEEAAPKRKAAAPKSSRKKSLPDFDDIFDDAPAGNGASKESGANRRKSPKESADNSEQIRDESDSANDAPGLNDPFMELPGNESEKPESGPSNGAKRAKRGDSKELVSPDAEEELPRFEAIVEQLTSRGAVRTHWFSAGDRYPVGFAVYFRGRSDDERIRFEAVGQTRDECARDVLDQVDAWQKRRQKN